MSLDRNTENRAWLLDRLRAEIVGPDPSGTPFHPPPDHLISWDQFQAPKRQPNGEEILWQDSPIKRYGAGVLFPRGLTDQGQLAGEAATAPEADAHPPDSDATLNAPDQSLSDRVSWPGFDDASEDLELALANEYRPSAIGLSFLGNLDAATEGFEVEVDCAQYHRVDVRCGDSAEEAAPRSLWYRIPVRTQAGDPPVVAIDSTDALRQFRVDLPVPGCEQSLKIAVISRPLQHLDPRVGHRLITVCLVNTQVRDSGRVDELSFFQCSLSVRGRSAASWILPYPEYRRANPTPDDEEEVARLLYRARKTFAVGHGCAADWHDGRPLEISELRTDCMPTFETPQMETEILDHDGQPLRASMRKLAGLVPHDDGTADLDALIHAYQSWIDGVESTSDQDFPIPQDLRGTAQILVSRCRDCLWRIEEGLRFLRQDSPTGRIVREAFQLTNHSMLIAQLRSSREIRTPRWESDRWVWDEPIPTVDPAQPHPDRGYWRGFQIAFLLMGLPGVCDPKHPDRRLVDLIWFPTGGGKTEAYLALAAFTVFYNRLSGLNTSGADVLMRYTLRLLTAQQFQRAGLLFCAMEYLRRQPHNRDRLGEAPFRLGMWVGGAATPNTRSDARRALKRLQRDPGSENPFVLLKCPWCNSRFGPLQGANPRVLGYFLCRLPDRSETVVYRCEDPRCDFGNNPRDPGRHPLPITVVDEDIYQTPPDLLIGTVDKFAMLAWNPEIRSIFGIGDEGLHTGHPPTLIIQDELHLISGPLGSMVGAYETVIEELCTGRQGDQLFRPKIVASTATISKSSEQIKALYGRPDTMLFPPPGLDAGNSFFSHELLDAGGRPVRGRQYTGILAPGHGSLQTTQARVFAALLQYPRVMPVKDEVAERDPWWTLIAFFNSLRELGGAATLLVADTRDYLRVLIDRHGHPYKAIRPLLNWLELTSRIRSDEIPATIQKLEIPFSPASRDAVEACLASNIIEVGIDIDRLALMTITGQPKTTSQYIQVSSRIGRRHDAPGLVVTMYSPTKPRDRSHYERFRPYHEGLHASVEPTSVTPMSPPAVDRALHALIVAAVRQLSSGSISRSPRPFPLDEENPIREVLERMIESRTRVVDPEELPNVRAMLERRLAEWRAWDPREYGNFGTPSEDTQLMYPAGSSPPPSWHGHGWPTLSSLRDVDANCEAEVTTYYHEVRSES